MRRCLGPPLLSPEPPWTVGVPWIETMVLWICCVSVSTAVQSCVGALQALERILEDHKSPVTFATQNSVLVTRLSSANTVQ